MRGPRHPVLLAVVGYVVVRLLMLASIVLTIHARGGHALGRLAKADGYWYLRIAAHGYGTPPPIGPDGAYVHTTPLAFFPLYPWLIRWVGWVGLPRIYAALLLTAVFGTLAAALITCWARPVVGDRGAVVLTLLWSILPTSVVLDMAYSEALFVAAAAGCLLALQRRWWLTAGVAAAVAGLTRPTAAALVLGLWLAAALQLRRSGWQPRPVLAAAVGASGLAVSLGHVAAATGRLDGWFWLERTVWRSGFDGGWSFAQDLARTAAGTVGPRWPVVVAGVVAAAFVAAYVWWLRARPAIAEAAYVTVAGLLALGERNYPHVKPRFLLVAFPVLVPPARALARRSTSTLVLLGVPALAASLAWNTYLVAVWPRSV